MSEYDVADGAVVGGSLEVLTATGKGGLVSKGKLPEQPFVDYLNPDEQIHVAFWSHSSPPTVEGLDAQEPALGNYRAITAVTDRRFLTVTGTASGDAVIAVPLEDITTYETGATGVIRREQWLRIFTDEGELCAYDRSGIDLTAVEDSITAAVTTAKERHVRASIEEADQLKQQGELESALQTLRTAEKRYERLVDWSGRYGVSHNQELEQQVEQRIFQIHGQLKARTEVADTATHSEASSSSAEPVDGERTQNSTANQETESEPLEEEPDPEPAERQTDSTEEASTVAASDETKDIKRSAAAEPSPTDGSLLQELWTLDETLGRPPTPSDVETESRFSLGQYEAAFGNWEKALAAAGIEGSPELADERERDSSWIDAHGQEFYSDGDYDDRMSAHTISEDSGSEQANYWEATDELPSENQGGADKQLQSAILRAIVSLGNSLGRAPTASEFVGTTGFSEADYVGQFGGWPAALSAADLDIEQSLKEELRDVAQKVEQTPTVSEVEAHGVYSEALYRRHFDSLQDAIEKAGIEFDAADSGPAAQSTGPTAPAAADDTEDEDTTQATEEAPSEREELIESLRTLHTRLGRVPKTTDLPDEFPYSAHDYISTFGSWDDSLEAAGLDREQEMIDEIERVAVELGRPPTSSDVTDLGLYSGGTYSSYFGSFDNALEQADIPVNTTGGNSTTDTADSSKRDTLKRNLRSLYEEKERLPSTADVRDELDANLKEYVSVFGSWNAALEAADINKEELLLKEVERLHERLGWVPTESDMSEDGIYSSRLYTAHFGDWNTVLERAGLVDAKREDMLDRLRDLHDQLERAPKTTHLPSDSPYGPNAYTEAFGSWDDALEAAGIDKKREMVEDIERVAAEIGHRPNSVDMDEHGNYAGSSYSTYFGSWSAALEQADLDEVLGEQAAVDHDPSTGRRERRLITELRTLDEELDRLPKTTDLHERSGVTQHDYISTFGSWEAALEAAGIDKRQVLIDELQRVADQLERRPKTAEMNEHGEYSASMYSKFFGSWGEALEAANITDRVAHSSGNETQRSTESTATGQQSIDEPAADESADGILDDIMDEF